VVAHAQANARCGDLDVTCASSPPVPHRCGDGVRVAGVADLAFHPDTGRDSPGAPGCGLDHGACLVQFRAGGISGNQPSASRPIRS
jgi:hypothetical protein